MSLQTKSNLSLICRILVINLLIMLAQGLTPAFGINKISPAKTQLLNQSVKHKLPPIPAETIEKLDKKGKNAILFSAIGFGLVIATIAVISIGTFGSTLPLAILGLAALFGNIGFIKAIRIRSSTKSRKKIFAKARKKAKIALILASVLGITLIFGLLHLMMEKALT